MIVTAARFESTQPAQYRLAKKPDGELVLQGAFCWQDGRLYGHEWRNIETVELDTHSPIPQEPAP